MLHAAYLGLGSVCMLKKTFYYIIQNLSYLQYFKISFVSM